MNELELIENEPILEATLDNDVLKDVLFLGFKSTNNREYSADALKEAVGLYDAKPIYIDHSSTERKLSERFGTSENARFTDKGIVGDIKVLTSHPLFSVIKESYDKRTPSIGISQNAVGTGEVRDGTMIVNKIVKVISLDLVSNAASVRNLRESEDKTVQLNEQIQILTAEKTSLAEANTKLTEQVTSLTKEVATLKEQQTKWQVPKSVPLTEKVSEIPKDIKKLAAWLASK
jgi:hypothetical protein